MVRWSKPSKQDLRHIYDFIAKDSAHYAQQVITTIVEKVDKLNIFPYMGRIVPEKNEEEIREILIYSYRIIYQINLNDIEILALVHSKKDFNTIESCEPQSKPIAR
ncbi:type II toxin-antitoxin system RelE/ParE family toxin [Desulfosporosinus fructosivorans]